MGLPGFLKALVTIKDYLDHFWEQWWAHCFPGEEGFSLTEFRNGLDWLLTHPDCPGGHGGKGLDRCPIRLCALMKILNTLPSAPIWAACEKYNFILKEFPQQKAELLRRQSRKPEA